MRRKVLSLIATPLTLIAAIVSLVISTSVLAGQSQTKTRQSPDEIVAVLKTAENEQSSVDATIEVQAPLDAHALEDSALSGQIQSIRITSTTTKWVGILYRTPNSTITSLAAGLRDYERLYREAKLGDANASFAMTAFTLRGSTAEVSQARDSLRNATYRSVILSSVATQKNQSVATNSQTPSATARSEGTGEAVTAPAAPWVPNNAELNIQTLSNSDRQVQVSFSWNTPQDLGGFLYDRSALEIQVIFLNQSAAILAPLNNLTYIGDNVRFIGADFFHAYLDDTFLDNASIREVTVGSYDAKSISKRDLPITGRL